ncbi:hypothetical protein HHI36_007597 [Cryptolaemus montrouzieri]|uniref:Uncharacterized protein n=1 Tax=Cryptolaemus montrouzieri TaxID=559131 RepID=A0ABD2MPZ9_9CUCU
MLTSDEGEEVPKDLVQKDDSWSKIDMDEGNEEEDGEDSVRMVLIDHPNDKDNNEANGDKLLQTKKILRKDRFKWSSAPISQSRKTPAKILTTFIPRLRGPTRDLGDTADPFSIWENILSDDMIQEIVAGINEKL